MRLLLFLTVTTQTGAASSERATVAGLLIAIIAGVGEVAAYFASPAVSAGAHGAAFLFFLAPCAGIILVTVMALAVASDRQRLLPALLGLWAVSPVWALYGILGLFGFHVFSDGAHWIVAELLATLSDLAGTAAAVLLLAAVSKSGQRGRWMAPPAMSWTLFGVVVLGAAWFVEYAVPSLGPVYDIGSAGHFVNGGYVYHGYPCRVLGVAALLVTVLVAWYALTRRSRAVGGGILLGWSVLMIFDLLQTATSNSLYFDHKAIAIEIGAGVFLAASVVITGVYLTRPPVAAG
jgi:hypothetical protein